MLCGGEPLVVDHFLEVAEELGNGGVEIKVETNGQRMTERMAARLSRLPVRSIQVSLDADTQDVYARQRPGGSLEKAHAACRAARKARLPLEVAFAPSRINIRQAEAVIDRAASLGAFRFNTGALMRLGRADPSWSRLGPSQEEYRLFRELLARKKSELAGRMELCYLPFTLQEGLEESLCSPPATLLMLPDGRVKVSGPLPFVCADLRTQSLAEAWDSYRRAWRHPVLVRKAADVLAGERLLGKSGESTVLAGSGRDRRSHERADDSECDG
jgi:MoaA/NifB/PqqE/SkfB family radical SAM enzyme